MKIFRESIPGISSECDKFDHVINSLDDVFKIEWVKTFSIDSNFKKFDVRDNTLWATYEYKIKEGECMFVARVGELIGFSEN